MKIASFVFFVLLWLAASAHYVATGLQRPSSLQYDKKDGLLFKEFELILRPGQGRQWPPSECASTDGGVAQRVTETLRISNTSFTVIAKVFDTVVMLVNTTGLFTDTGSGGREQVNATEMASIIVKSINEYESDESDASNSTSTTSQPSSVYEILGRYFVGQCEVYKSALEYTPVKVPGYLSQPEGYNRTGFYVLGGLAGLCILLQFVYGILHWRRFDMVVLKDADEQSID